MSEVDKRDSGVKSGEIRNSRRGWANLKLQCKLSESYELMDGFVGRGCGGKEEKSARLGRFLEEAGLSLFKSHICGVRTGNEGVRSGRRVKRFG